MQVAVLYASLLAHLIPFIPRACVAIEMSSTITHNFCEYMYREKAGLTRDVVLCLAWVWSMVMMEMDCCGSSR